MRGFDPWKNKYDKKMQLENIRKTINQSKKIYYSFWTTYLFSLIFITFSIINIVQLAYIIL